MKIENKFIKINNGKKNFKIRNHIFDNYINFYSLRQYQELGGNTDLRLNKLLIKFDAPILNPQYSEGYEVKLDGTVNQDYSNNYVRTDYYYRTSDLHNIDVDLSQWYGHKIYALGFGQENYEGTGYSVFAYVDVSDYDLYLTDDGFLDVIREDLMSSDAICDSIPYHLAPFLDNKIGRIYSVGLGTISDVISEEYIVGDNVHLEPLSEQIGFQFTFGSTTDFTQYPQYDLQPLTTIFPTPFIINSPELDPLEENIYPATDMYPLQTNYKYVIYKYRVYEYNYTNFELIPTNEYYLMSYPYTRKGVITINTIYERSDV